MKYLRLFDFGIAGGFGDFEDPVVVDVHHGFTFVMRLRIMMCEYGPSFYWCNSQPRATTCHRRKNKSLGMKLVFLILVNISFRDVHIGILGL